MQAQAISATAFSSRQAKRFRFRRRHSPGIAFSEPEGSNFILRLLRPDDLQADLEEQLVQTFEEQRPRLLRALQAFLRSSQDTEDAVQNAFLRCWQSRARLAEVENLSAWIWRAGINAGRDLLDEAWRRRAKPLEAAGTAPVISQAAPLELIIDREERQRLGAALALLRPAEKDVFLFRQQGGLSFAAIAQLRDTPVGTVKTLMHRALAKIRRFLGCEAA